MKSFPSNLRVFFCSCLLGLILTDCTSSKPSINIAPVAYNDIVQRVTVPGSVVANRKTLISAPYSGYIKKIYVHLGQKVQEGEPIVSITQSLRNSNEEVFPLRAPFGGTVVQVLRTEGEYIEATNYNVGSSVVRIDDISKLFVEAIAPEAEISKLREGQEVVIKASALLSHAYKGKIRHISLAAKEQKEWSDKTRVEFTLQIEVLNPDSSLLPGMSVIVDIITNEAKHVLTLRHEYIQKENDSYFVVAASGKKKSIQVGIQNEEFFEIKSGLSEGEQIQQNDFLLLLTAPTGATGSTGK